MHKNEKINTESQHIIACDASDRGGGFEIYDVENHKPTTLLFSSLFELPLEMRRETGTSEAFPSSTDCNSVFFYITYSFICYFSEKKSFRLFETPFVEFRVLTPF